MTRRAPFVVVKKRLPALTRRQVARIEARLDQGDAPRDVAAGENVSLATVYNVSARRAPAERQRETARVVHDPGECRRAYLTELLKPDRPEPMGVAKAVWGLRLACGEDCLRLDGHPVTFHGLMRRTNAALAADGLPVLRAFE